MTKVLKERSSFEVMSCENGTSGSCLVWLTSTSRKSQPASESWGVCREI